MSSRTISKNLLSRSCLSFNMKNIDAFFPGFSLGNFAVLYGSSAILSLSMLLCVRAQLPYQLGGLETNVTFVDGGNTFRLYDISNIARLYELNPKKVLERIFISRAFTAYQMTAIILDRLQETVDQHDSEFVMISDISGLFLDKDISVREAREVFNQLVVHLSTFAQKNHVVVAATYMPHHLSDRNIFFKTIICGCANVIISTMPCEHDQKFILEKHPFFDLGSTHFSSEDYVLTKFMETHTWAKL